MDFKLRQTRRVMYTKVATMLCPSENMKIPRSRPTHTRITWRMWVARQSFFAWTGIMVPVTPIPTVTRGRRPRVIPYTYNCGSFGVESVTDGTLERPMFSETLLGSGSCLRSRSDQLAASGRRPYLFPSGFESGRGSSGPTAANQAFASSRYLQRLCRAQQPAFVAPPASKQQHVDQRQHGLDHDLGLTYNHFLPPNSPWSCNRQPRQHGRICQCPGRFPTAKQQPPGGRQYGNGRRACPVHQELNRDSDLVGTRHPKRG